MQTERTIRFDGCGDGAAALVFVSAFSVVAIAPAAALVYDVLRRTRPIPRTLPGSLSAPLANTAPLPTARLSLPLSERRALLAAGNRRTVHTKPHCTYVAHPGRSFPQKNSAPSLRLARSSRPASRRSHTPPLVPRPPEN